MTDKAGKLRDSRERSLNNLARAFGGAFLFSFPIMMTMEMWWQGFVMNNLRLALFTALSVPLLIGLSYFDGFEDTFTAGDDVRETFMAYAIGFTASALMLFLFGVITSTTSPAEAVGKIAVQTVTAGLGAMFAQSILGGDEETEADAETRKRSAGYWGQLFLTVVGAIFLSMSVAPTEEMYLISYKITNWHVAALVIASLLVMHGFIYAVEQCGLDKGVSAKTPFWSLFFRYTVVGYAVVLLTSFYILWTFGSVDGKYFAEQVKVAVVLGFPAGVGGAASRLIL